MFILQALPLGREQWQTEIFYQMCAFCKSKMKHSLVTCKVLIGSIKIMVF